MTFDPVKPRYTLSFAGKDYELEGTFGLIADIEHALKDNIISVTMRSIEMPVHEMAKLLSVLLASAGEKLTPAQVGETIWNTVGVGSQEYTLLCLHVHAFLRITIAKPQDREEAKKKMGELLKGITNSPGENTDASASAS